MLLMTNLSVLPLMDHEVSHHRWFHIKIYGCQLESEPYKYSFSLIILIFLSMRFLFLRDDIYKDGLRIKECASKRMLIVIYTDSGACIAYANEGCITTKFSMLVYWNITRNFFKEHLSPNQTAHTKRQVNLRESVMIVLSFSLFVFIPLSFSKRDF